MTKTSVVIAVSAVMIGGCATSSHQTWIKAGTSPDDLARDRYACIQQSRVPYGTSFGSAGWGASGGSAGWGSRAGYVQGGTDGGFQPLGAVRHAQSQANRTFDACMESRGWRAGSNIVRADPATPLTSTAPPPVITVAPSAGLSGTFAGNISGIQGDRSFTMGVSFTIVQTEDKIAGAWTSTGGTSGTVTATVEGDTLINIRVRQLNPCEGEFAGIAAIEVGGLRLRGSYLGNGCGSPVNASFIVNRQR